ncbi:MAG TPA: hypothetical protein VEW93_09540 [Acidimicrobiales bacterium]|nr:hypothetical protein [Acidimicrobiales bacterium]
MANRGRQSAEKRRIDKMRQEQQAAKRERRHSRDAQEAEDGVDGASEEELFERFRLLSEAHAAGTVSDEDFGPARHTIMVALGLEEPTAPPADEDED